MEDQPFDFTTPITENTTLIAMYDCPNGVTLTQLRAALTNGTAATTYPVNTQIDDYTNGAYDPWIVGYYGKQYGSDTDGVYLYRKYLYPEDKVWGESGSYANSEINTWLNTTYLESCSDNIKNFVTELDLPLVNGTVKAKMFLMSAAEVMADSTGYAGGVAWESWKIRTGLSTSGTQPNEGRIMSKGELHEGLGDAWLLRTTLDSQNGVMNITDDGASRVVNPSTKAGIAVACFIAKPDYNPSNPTLEGIKAAVDAGDYTAFPAGTEIPDTYGGHSSPLVVAQYLDSTNNSSYGDAEGVILVRKYLEAPTMAFGDTVDYTTSTAKNYLDTTYFDNCSGTLKNMISEISIPYYNGETVVKIPSKWFVMSATEICGKGAITFEGIMWDYWKNQTGLTTANNSNNPGRIMRNGNLTALNAYLRSYANSSNVYHVNTNGYIWYDNLGTTIDKAIPPACFIAKNLASGPITAAEFNTKNITPSSANITANEFNNNAKGML